MNKTEMKYDARTLIGLVVFNLSSSFEEDRCPPGWSDWMDDQKNQYREIMKREAERVVSFLAK